MSMTLAVPFLRFYTRSLYFDMTLSSLVMGREERRRSWTATQRTELARPRSFQANVSRSEAALQEAGVSVETGTGPGTLTSFRRCGYAGNCFATRCHGVP